MVSRGSQRIGVLRVKRTFVDTSMLLCCYFAFVLSILEYCYSVWRSTAECLLERQVYSVVIIWPPNAMAASAAHPLVFELSRCRTFQFVIVSCRPRFECGLTFTTLCLTPERWTGSRVQSTVGCFLEFTSVFRGAGACGVAKATFKLLCFSRSGLCCWFL